MEVRGGGWGNEGQIKEKNERMLVRGRKGEMVNEKKSVDEGQER